MTKKQELDEGVLAKKILAGFVVGVIAGCSLLVIGSGNPETLEYARKLGKTVLEPLGQVFLRMLFFVVVPLVFCSLTAGVLQLGANLEKLGNLAIKTGSLFVVNMGVAVIFALVAMHVVRPGEMISAEMKSQIVMDYAGKSAQALHMQEHAEITATSLLNMFFPKNLLGAIANFEVLPLIIFALLMGTAGTMLTASKRERLAELLDLGTDLMTTLVRFAMKLAPYAVPLMLFSIIVQAGVDILKALAVFSALCLTLMAFHLFVSMSVLLKLFTRRNPIQFFKDIRTVLITAFATSSSNGTLPTSIRVAREELKLSTQTTGFVLPLGATMNMSGTALYEGAVVLFVAQVYGVDLTVGQQAQLLFFAVVSAIAVAGVPGASLPLVAGLLVNFGIPAEGLALIIGVDRVLDMARTTLNVGADLVTATIVDEQMMGRSKHTA